MPDQLQEESMGARDFTCYAASLLIASGEVEDAIAVGTWNSSSNHVSGFRCASAYDPTHFHIINDQ